MSNSCPKHTMTIDLKSALTAGMKTASHKQTSVQYIATAESEQIIWRHHYEGLTWHWCTVWHSNKKVNNKMQNANKFTATQNLCIVHNSSCQSNQTTHTRCHSIKLTAGTEHDRHCFTISELSPLQLTDSNNRATLLQHNALTKCINPLVIVFIW